ncbi:MAG: hypothetical protein GDA48_25120 [Hormoscilla sp. GM102CHS1]|nr:hypothetical protein [Hormoscilla sp. GM102CHS1]
MLRTFFDLGTSAPNTQIVGDRGRQHRHYLGSGYMPMRSQTMAIRPEQLLEAIAIGVDLRLLAVLVE